MAIKKSFLKTKPVCKVTFTLTADEVGEAEQVTVVGDFNGWDAAATPMKRSKTGVFKLDLDLEPGRSYQFRYLVDAVTWLNDPEADAEAPTQYGDSCNSVLDLTP